MKLNSEILKYYNKGMEKNRLKQDGFLDLEKIRTLDILFRYLPESPASILDVGGATGVYAFPLAERGYEVHLIDPVELHLSQAREINESADKKLASIQFGDARYLTKYVIPNLLYDVVLLFGPLYHLTNQNDRILALKETLMILKHGGLVFSAGISKFASLFNGFERRFIFDSEFRKIVEEDLKTGQHRNPTDKPHYFTDAFFHHPNDFVDEHKKVGFQNVEYFSIEGPLHMIPNLKEFLSDTEKTDLLLDYARKIEQEPSLAGATGHMLVKGEKGYNVSIDSVNS